MTTFCTPKQSASFCCNSFGKKQGGMSKILRMKMLDFVRQLQLSASWCQGTEQVLLCDGLDGLHGPTLQWDEINFEGEFSFVFTRCDFYSLYYGTQSHLLVMSPIRAGSSRSSSWTIFSSAWLGSARGLFLSAQ